MTTWAYSPLAYSYPRDNPEGLSLKLQPDVVSQTQQMLLAKVCHSCPSSLPSSSPAPRGEVKLDHFSGSINCTWNDLTSTPITNASPNVGTNSLREHEHSGDMTKNTCNGHKPIQLNEFLMQFFFSKYLHFPFFLPAQTDEGLTLTQEAIQGCENTECRNLVPKDSLYSPPIRREIWNYGDTCI